MTRRELSKELQTRRSSRGDRLEARGFNKRCFVGRDTKQTEKGRSDRAKNFGIEIEQLRTQAQREPRRERANRESEVRAESSDELESTSLPAKLRAALAFVYVCVSLEIAE